MSTRAWLAILSLVGAVFTTATTEAFTLAPFSVRQMARQADKIFAGTCIAVEESKNDSGLSVLTVTFAVHDVLKGQVGETVTFRQLNPIQPPPPRSDIGGLWGAIPTFGLPTYTKGEEVILFLQKEGRTGLTSPLGFQQGKLPVALAMDGGKTVTNMALRAEPSPTAAIPQIGKTGDYGQFVTAIRALVQPTK